jgi:hypothetical protein
MSDLVISVSVEGEDLAAWEDTFRAALSQAGGASLLLSTIGTAGALGARRSRALKVATPGADGMDTAIKTMGLVLSALSLAVASVQLGIALKADDQAPPPVRPTFTCTVEGPQGKRQLEIAGAAIPSEHVLRECIRATGTPIKLSAQSPRRPA